MRIFYQYLPQLFTANSHFKFKFCRHVFEYLSQQLTKLAAEQKLDSVHFLTKDFHVWPDLHGNRSPLADSTVKGMICGLSMSASVDNLAITYLAFVQALSVRLPRKAAIGI